MSYLENLTMQLANGVSQLPNDLRKRHADYIIARQNEDGGFSGREGGSDLYYTGFALRGLAVLGAMTPQIADRAAAFLISRLSDSASIVDFYSFLYSALVVQTGGGPNVLENAPADWPDRVAKALEEYRVADGGYGKSPNSKSGSTYHTFLVGMCFELLGRALPDAEGVLKFVASRQREDGGYVEIAPMRRSGANPTAAAVGIMQLVFGEQFDPEKMNSVIDFLTGLVSMEGGLCANTRIPVADLLSTFTGAWTLQQLGALDRIDKPAALTYVRSLAEPAGGFRGGAWDEKSDVEYTFYGLGAMALVTANPKSEIRNPKSE